MSDNPLAALAMRERAAAYIDARHEIHMLAKGRNPDKYISDWSMSAIEIRALPTTFTDAELLAAAMQLPEVRALVEAAEATANIIANCAVVSGICCCGDPMEVHLDPYSCGHSPVDSGGYAWDRQSKKFETTLAPFMKGAP